MNKKYYADTLTEAIDLIADLEPGDILYIKGIPYVLVED
jgi:hypothetical protein